MIDTAAVAPAIASGQLAGAGIDVLPEEPPRDDDPLVGAVAQAAHPAYQRMLINPHSAFYCEEGLMEMRTKRRRRLSDGAAGANAANIINGLEARD